MKLHTSLTSVNEPKCRIRDLTNTELEMHCINTFLKIYFDVYMQSGS